MIKAIEALKISLQRRKEIDEDEVVHRRALIPKAISEAYEEVKDRAYYGHRDASILLNHYNFNKKEREEIELTFRIEGYKAKFRRVREDYMGASWYNWHLILKW